MSEENEAEVPVTQITAVQDERNESLLDNLQRKRADLATKETYIHIPGYDKDPPILLAKYRLVEGKELDMLGDKVTRETKNKWDRQVLAAVDTFITCCEGMYVDHGDGEPKPMTLEGEHIWGYNEQLATALNFEAKTAREVVFGVFVNNEIAIMQHNMMLSRWMSNTSRQVDDDFLGLA